jgi:hypothetical protein
MWGSAVGICYSLKVLLPGPSVLQLIMGVAVFACIALIGVRSPVLCDSDRELMQRLFQGRESRLFKILGLVGAPVV